MLIAATHGENAFAEPPRPFGARTSARDDRRAWKLLVFLGEVPVTLVFLYRAISDTTQPTKLKMYSSVEDGIPPRPLTKNLVATSIPRKFSAIPHFEVKFW